MLCDDALSFLLFARSTEIQQVPSESSSYKQVEKTLMR